MRERIFGKAGWRVRAVGLGCWQFGGAITLDGQPDGWTGITDEESLNTIHRAVELGVNFFDTADMYGWGHSEELLGRALKPHREHVYIATKVGYWKDDTGRRTFNESRDYILRACDASLRRLQTDHIDLYQCHLWKTERWMEFLDAFETLQRQGKIRHFGVSTNEFDVIEHFDARRALTAVQSNYNLLDRRAEKEILPYCRSRGIAFIARGPLARGLLSGNYTQATTFADDDIRTKMLDPANRPQFERDIATVNRLRPVADKLRRSLPELAIQFALGHIGVTLTIPGAKNRTQLEANCSAGKLLPLTRDELTTIERALNG
jgi:aryl-alcohol dehydrogenase-like predicted oxidoreductase